MKIRRSSGASEDSRCLIGGLLCSVGDDVSLTLRRTPPDALKRDLPSKMVKAGYISSRFRGVYSQDGGKKWPAYLVLRGKKIQVGTFETEVHAARAVDK